MATPPLTTRKNTSFADALKRQKWLTLIGLPVLLVTTFMGIYTLWGVLFVFWGLMAVRAGQLYLLEDIERREDPVLYWIIVAMWIVTGGLYVIGDLFPQIWY